MDHVPVTGSPEMPTLSKKYCQRSSSIRTVRCETHEMTAKINERSVDMLYAAPSPSMARTIVSMESSPELVLQLTLLDRSNSISWKEGVVYEKRIVSIHQIHNNRCSDRVDLLAAAFRPGHCPLRSDGPYVSVSNGMQVHRLVRLTGDLNSWPLPGRTSTN